MIKRSIKEKDIDNIKETSRISRNLKCNHLNKNSVIILDRILDMAKKWVNELEYRSEENIYNVTHKIMDDIN